MSTALLTQTAINQSPMQSIVRDGIAGNYDIVFQMVRIVRQTIAQQNFQSFVKNLFIKNGLDINSKDEKNLRFIDKYVKKNVAYESDIEGRIESIKSADVTLSDGYGDCDDFSILYASILAVANFQPRFVLATYHKSEKQFSHIYVDLIENKKRFVFDAVIPNGKFNSEVKPLTTATIDILKANETDSINGLIKQIGLALKGLYKNSLETIPTLAGFSPIGLLSYYALSTGAGVASAGLSKNQSLNELGSRIHRQLDEIIKGLHNHTISDDLAEISALQIASQLSSYKVKNQREQQTYKTVSASIKNKLQYIEKYNSEKDSKVELNHNGMALIGAVAFGYFGYQAYKQIMK